MSDESAMFLAVAMERKRCAKIADEALSMLLDAAQYAETYEGKTEWAKNARAAVARARNEL